MFQTLNRKVLLSLQMIGTEEAAMTAGNGNDSGIVAEYAVIHHRCHSELSHQIGNIDAAQEILVRIIDMIQYEQQFLISIDITIS